MKPLAEIISAIIRDEKRRALQDAARRCYANGTYTGLPVDRLGVFRRLRPVLFRTLHRREDELKKPKGDA